MQRESPKAKVLRFQPPPLALRSSIFILTVLSISLRPKSVTMSSSRRSAPLRHGRRPFPNYLILTATVFDAFGRFCVFFDGTGSAVLCSICSFHLIGILKVGLIDRPVCTSRKPVIMVLGVCIY